MGKLVDPSVRASVHFYFMTLSTTKPPRRFRAHLIWHILGGTIVSGWIFVMAFMFWPATMGDSGVLLNRVALQSRFPNDDSWMSAFHKGRKLGYVHTLISLKGQSVELVQHSRLKISVAGITQALDSDLELFLNEHNLLKSIFFSMTAGPIALSFSGRMRKEGLEIDLQTGAKHSTRIIPMDEPPVLDLTVPFALAQLNLYPGARFRVEVFDPRLMHNTISSVEVLGSEALNFGGKLVVATHVRRISDHIKLDSWIDQAGRVLKEEAQGGLLLIRQNKEQALAVDPGKSTESDSTKGWLHMVAPGELLPREEL